MFLTAASFSLMRWPATTQARLYKPEHAAQATAALRRSLRGPGLYVAALATAQVSVPVSVALQIVVPILFFVPMRVPGRMNDG